MPYDPQRHHRRSIRLRGYDYTQPAAYYVTICIAGREHLLGQVVGGEMTLSPAGQIVAAAWRDIPRHFPHASLDASIIMPDHLHGIVVIKRAVEVAPIADSSRAISTIPGSLPAIIQNFKSVSSRRINQMQRTPGRRVWQEDYYEHIVRDESDMERIRRYIAANPARWRG